MHLFSRGFVATLATAGVLLTGCTSSSDEAPQAPSATPTATSTASAPTTPMVDIAALPVRQLTDKVPTQLPQWKQGDDPRAYSVQTLEYVVAMAHKAGVAVPPVPYAVYTGSGDEIVDCGSYNIASLAKNAPGADYCATLNGGQTGILLIPNKWMQTNPWGEDYHPLHYLIEALAVITDGSGSIDQDCAVGKIYASLVLAQPKLATTVAAFLAPAGKLEYHPSETQRNIAYARMVDGRSADC
jgi:hypothetical protein